MQQRLLRDRETKIQKALERLRRKRRLLGQQRRRREFPVVSVVGYTNCGEGRVRGGGQGTAGGQGARAWLRQGPPQGVAGGRGLPGAGLVDVRALGPGLWVGSPLGCIGGRALPGTGQGCMGLMGGASLGRGLPVLVGPHSGGAGGWTRPGARVVGGISLRLHCWAGLPVSTFPPLGRHVASAQLHHHASV